MRHAPLSTIKNALARVTHSRKDQLGVDLSAAIIQEQVLPTFVLDADGRVIVWNRACETLTGLTAAELLGTNEHWRAFYASERPCLVDLVLGRGAASRELYSKSETQGAQGAMHAENWCELTNGKRAYLSIIASPIRGSDGKLLAAVETLRDLTAEKLAEDRLASERLQQTEKIAFLTDQLGRALKGLAQGDLVSRIDAPFAPDVEALKRDFNAASADLLRMVVAIGDIARHVEDETANIAQATDELAQRTERQAASVEETSAALTQVSSAVRRNSQEALEAELLVGQAKLHAQESQEVMSAALRAMSGIQRFAQDISQVIAVIYDMAFQTNLLALNAGVEAARAGEAGRGFAVVASEVRALARRSAEAAKEIKALIAASAAHVTEGVTQVNGTATKLTRMGTEIERISGIIQNMSGSARDQSVALDEISRAVAVIDRDTQQNAAMVEEVTAASSSLSEEGRKLVVYTSRFTTAAAPAKALSRAG